MYFLNRSDRSKGKKVLQRFQTSYGLGRNKSKQLASCLGFSRRTRVLQTAMVHDYNLASLVSKEKYTRYSKQKEKILGLSINIRLKSEEARKINKKIAIYCYQGIRHNYNLPVHGQRTHSHGSTQRLLGAKRNVARRNLRVYFSRSIRLKKKRKFSKKEIEVMRLKKKIYLRRLRRMRKHSRVKMRRRGKGVLTKK